MLSGGGVRPHRLSVVPSSWDAADVVPALRSALEWTESGCKGLAIDDLTTASDRTALLKFSWFNDPHRFGLEIPFPGETSLLTGEPIESLQQWASDAAVLLLEELDTGLVVGAARSQGDGYILLGERSWPFDERFYISDIGSSRRLQFLRADGLDTATPSRLRRQGDFITWYTAYVNNRWGEPYVGQVVASWQSPTTASIEYLQVLDGAPNTVAIDLVATAAHEASSAGAEQVVTRLEVHELSVIGFRPSQDGLATLDTNFLAADHEQARRLVRHAQAAPHPWANYRSRNRHRAWIG
jgi:hypothetical protein